MEIGLTVFLIIVSTLVLGGFLFVLYAFYLIALDVKKFFITRNHLYTCGSCQRLFRLWQAKLFAAKEGTRANTMCPHCKKAGHYNKSELKISFGKYVEEEEKWMKQHSHCPTISFIENFNVKRSIKLYRKMQEDDKKVLNWKAYNSLPESNWLQRLQQADEK